MPTTTASTIIDPLVSGALRAHCIRLHPGDDLIPCLQEAARQTGAAACFILTTVGSLDQVSLRMASAEDGSNNEIKTWNNERFEIVSLVGTLAPDAKHLHMCISDKDGTAFGGHLISGRVFTTVELVLGTADGVAFSREHDPNTGYQELVVSSLSQNH
jgi:predicted DNA-binding protein with PD1-like motif